MNRTVLLPLSVFSKISGMSAGAVWKRASSGKPLPSPSLGVFRLRGDNSKLLVEVAVDDSDLEQFFGFPRADDPSWAARWLPVAISLGYARGVVCRFVDKIVPSAEGCWVWTGSSNGSGYGFFQMNGKVVLAHRASLMLFVGPSQGEGSMALHSCDNPPCVNPEHLRWGSSAENMIDRSHRGRTSDGDRNGSRVHGESISRGSAHYRTKLTEEQVASIRERVVAGETQTALAQEFGLKKTSIAAITHGRTWKQAEGPIVDGDLSSGRGRRVQGEDHMKTSLTTDVVQELKRRLAAGADVRALAREHGLSRTIVRGIATGKTWRSVDVDGFTPRDTEASAWAKSKLTADDAREIKRRLASGEPMRQIANSYGVVFSTIHHIKSGRTWRDA